MNEDYVRTKHVFKPGDIVVSSSKLSTIISNDEYGMFSLPQVRKDDLIMLIEPISNEYTQNYEKFQSLSPTWTVNCEKFEWWTCLLGNQILFIDTSWGIKVVSSMCEE